MVISSDIDGVVTTFNPAAERALGYRAEELIGKATPCVFHDPEELADRARAFSEELGVPIAPDFDVFAAKARRNLPNECEWTFVRKDGSRFPVLLSVTALRDPRGSLTGCLGMAIDITARKQAEEERKAHIRFLESMEQVDQAIKRETSIEQMLWRMIKVVFSIFDCDRAWLFHPCDPTAPTFRVPVEITKPEYPGAEVLNVDVPMPADMAANLQEALDSAAPVVYVAGTEHPVNKVSAEQFGVQSQMFIALYPKVGKPWAFGLHQCSHARIWTLEERTLFQEIARRVADGLSTLLMFRDLQESETKTRSILENIGLGVALISPQGEILELNHRMREWFPGAVPGQHPPWHHASSGAPGEAPCDDCPTLRTLRDGRVHEAATQIPRAGAVRHCRVVSSPLVAATGETTAVIEIVEDVTEKLSLESQLRQSQKMEAVGRLAGGVAHDFNNMLSVILGHAELALDEVEPSHPLFAPLQEIQKAGKRSVDLTRQLLAFARRQTVAPKVLDLNHTVAGMLKMLHRLIGEDIDLAWLPGAGVYPIKMDPPQLDQILANLCVNARDAISGVGSVTIETGNAAFGEEYCASHVDFIPGEYVMLAVSDSGTGMDKETMAKIFEPFFTTKKVGSGTGLGLATVYGIVRQNKGFINVYSEPGKGTTFRIYLPRLEGEGIPEEKPREAVAMQTGSETVLLVEDERQLLTLGRQSLEQLGYTVLAADNPEAALRLAREYSGVIHVLMTDVVMPGLSGGDLRDRLLALRPDVRCLFVSGYTANVIVHHGILDAGVHFLQKPYSIEALSAKLRETLRSS